MGTHRDQALFSRAKWRKAVLLPTWILQMLLQLSITGLFSYRLSSTVTTWKEEQDKGGVPTVLFVWEAVQVAFAFTSLVITFTEVAKFITEALSPLRLLFGLIIKLVSICAMLGLDITVYVEHSDKNWSIVGLAMDCALLAATILPTIYVFIVHRRVVEYDDYHFTGNVKHYGFNDGDTSYNAQSYADGPTLYDPTMPNAAGSQPQPRRPSIGMNRASSGSRSKSRSPNPADRGIPTASGSGEGLERRMSFDHKRDTQFDDYMAQRNSTAFKEDVERALGREFGWDDDRRSSVVSSGVVNSAQALQRGNSVPRRASWEANVDSPDGVMVQRGHSLHSVPESMEPEEDHLHSAQKNRPISEDREALLGNSRRDSDDSHGSAGRLPAVEGLQDVELESKKRRRDS